MRKRVLGVQYKTYGRRWARGLNKHEDQGIREFRVILLLTTILGCAGGLGLAIWVQLPWYGFLIGASLGTMFGFLVGRGFAQLWVPHRWEEILGAELERRRPTEQHVRETGGFRPERTKPHPDIFTTLFSLGMIKKRRLDMEPNRLYVADVGFNENFIYDTQLAGDNRKLFWKLNVRGAPPIVVLSIPYHLQDTTVEVTGIPVMGENDDSHQRLWIKVNYRVWVQLEIRRDRVRQFVQVHEPMRVVKNKVLTAAREVLPFQRYQDVLLAATSEQLGRRVKMYLDEAELGLEVAGVHIEEIEGSKELDESLQESFNRFRLAEDRQAIAVSLSQMDDHLIQLMHEYEGNQAALEFRSRAATRMVEGMLATGIPAKRLYEVTQEEARALGKGEKESLPELMNEAVRELEGPPPDSKPDCPDIPPGLTHGERLEWEARELKKRLPHIFRGLNIAEDRFEFDLASGQSLVIIFPAPKTTRPHVYVDSHSWTKKYRALWDDVYDLSYERTTVCELYYQTLKQLEKA